MKKLLCSLVFICLLPLVVWSAQITLDETVDPTLDGTAGDATGEDLRLTIFGAIADLNTMLTEIYTALAEKLDAGDVTTVSTDVEAFLGSANKAAMVTNLGSLPLNGLLDDSITTPADADDIIYRRTQKALTLTDIHCVAVGGGTITLTLQECDNATCASPSDIEGAITCDADGAEDDGTLADGAIAAGAWIKVLFSAPTGTVSSLAWSVDGVQTW